MAYHFDVEYVPVAREWLTWCNNCSHVSVSYSQDEANRAGHEHAENHR